MALRVLIVQSEQQTGQALGHLFIERGDQVWQANDIADAARLLEQMRPDLLVVDLHFPETDWLPLLRKVRTRFPDTRIIVTNKFPDFKRELRAREQGVTVFLREPFSQHWLDQAIEHLDETPQPVSSQPSKARPAQAVDKQPSVRMPVRIKITVPYMLLALLFALVGAYLVSRVIFNSIQERFNNQLVSTAKQSADWMVQEENHLLESMRLLANTQGMADAIVAQDAEGLRQLALPVAVNNKMGAVEILDTQGTSLLSLRHNSGGSVEDYAVTRGDSQFKQMDFVRFVLDRQQDPQGDKQAGLARTSQGDYFYVSGPVLAADGSLIGAILVGEPLADLVHQMSTDTLAGITLYDLNGQPITSTVFLTQTEDEPLTAQQVAQLLAVKDQSSLKRNLSVASNTYAELLGPWEARSSKVLGLLGVSLAQGVPVATSQITRAQIFVLVTIFFLLVIAVGVSIAGQITRPLLKVVNASSEVARGNLEVKVEPSGNDEVAVLAHAFNYMVAGLQEGSMYRDLLGRTVSPEVREQLRQTFQSGTLRLEGQEAVATVLMTDIRGFTTLSERADPATVFNWLNEYFAELVPIITANSGVVNKFDGDALLAFFGILPKLLPPKQSAYLSCRTAVRILKVVERINVRRVERGNPPLATGIGINTGVVTAGGLGTSDRMHYTIIGDTVNTTQRLEGLTRQLFNVSGIVISHSNVHGAGRAPPRVPPGSAGRSRGQGQAGADPGLPPALSRHRARTAGAGGMMQPPASRRERRGRPSWGAVFLGLLVLSVACLGLSLLLQDAWASSSPQFIRVALRSVLSADYSTDKLALSVPPAQISLIQSAIQDQPEFYRSAPAYGYPGGRPDHPRADRHALPHLRRDACPDFRPDLHPGHHPAAHAHAVPIGQPYAVGDGHPKLDALPLRHAGDRDFAAHGHPPDQHPRPAADEDACAAHPHLRAAHEDACAAAHEDARAAAHAYACAAAHTHARAAAAHEDERWLPAPRDQLSLKNAVRHCEIFHLFLSCVILKRCNSDLIGRVFYAE